MTPGRTPVRFAVVGAGGISQIVHVPVLAEREDVELVAVADPDTLKARTVAERFGVPETSTAEEIFARHDVDAVIISVPNHLHEDLATSALSAGKHVFVERPAALSPKGVARVLEAARAAGRRLAVGMPHRYRPQVSALRAFVAGGELGEVYAVRGSWLTRRTPVARITWRQKAAEAGGGALMDLGVTALDLCLRLIGYPVVTRVTASLSYGDFEVEDAATLMAETEDRVAITVEVSSRYFAPEDRYYARVMGSEGSGSLPPLEVFRQLGGRPLDVTPRRPAVERGQNPYTSAYRRQIDQFVRGVSGECDISLPEEHVGLMAVIQAAYRSAEEGREMVP